MKIEELCRESFIFHAWAKKHNFVIFFLLQFHPFLVIFLSLPFRSFIICEAFYDQISPHTRGREREMKNEAIEQGFLWQPRHDGKFDFSFKSFDISFCMCMRPPPFYNSYAWYRLHDTIICFFKYAHRSLLWHSKWYGNKK